MYEGHLDTHEMPKRQLQIHMTGNKINADKKYIFLNLLSDSDENLPEY
jgi:hypothetical protein